MFKSILKWEWVQNFIINAFVKILKAEINTAILKDPSIGSFRDGLYRDSISDFLTDSLNKLEPGVSLITPINLIKRRIAPIRDDVEGVIVKVLDGLAP